MNEPIKYETESIGCTSNFVSAVTRAWTEMGGEKQDNAVIPWFRGLANKDFKLTPSMYYMNIPPKVRTCSTEKDDRLNSIGYPSNFDEFWHFRHFMNKALLLDGSPKNKTQLDQWLFLLRHYGAPTRLTDWTEGALIALYFSVEDGSTSDACVWMLHPFRWNEAITYKYEIKDSDNPLVIEKYFSLVNAQFEYHMPKYTNTYLGKYALAIRPALSHPRLINQRSVFTIHGSELTHRNKSSDLNLKVSLEEQAQVIFNRLLPERRLPLLHKFVIVGCQKKAIRKQLAMMGITRATLFPDVDGLARDLTWQFTKD